MPEGPEVETVLRTLEKQIKGETIESINILYPKIIENDVALFKRNLMHQQFKTFKRQGKFLILGLTKGYLVIHLRMEGKFYIDVDDRVDKHTHVVFKLNSNRYLKYHDVRKFGRLSFVNEIKDHVGLSRLGPDVFDPQLTATVLYRKLQQRSIPIKQALLDQSIMASIGNIYANEICYASKIHPSTPSNLLSLYKVRQLLSNAKLILEQAIQLGGTTIRSYTSSLNVHGLFDRELKVHQVEECKLCHSKIEKIYINQRGTYFCPKCQKLKK